ncbi:MAG: sulfite exporter TauE/SafE family protein [Burkholderiales bacterium]|nr:sulfite exporter TauE/SafE family protein [Burkholderiales bacterium]
MIAVPAGIGGGTLFVPIVGSLFPFHLDFVRGAGLLAALASALSAAPTLLRGGMGSLRLALPLALLASLGSIAGAYLGLKLPAPVVQTLLGATVLGIVALMLGTDTARPSAPPRRDDALGRRLGLAGTFHDHAAGLEVAWQARRTGPALALFGAIGVLGGMFGIGAGWANVPALNLFMGLPLKVAAGTSTLVLAMSSSTAAWVYLGQGAVLPVIAVPTGAGMMLGARVGVRLLMVLHGAAIHRVVVGVLLFAGLRALFQGLRLWH